jgi:electron transfer flavoprotein alpha subunit
VIAALAGDPASPLLEGADVSLVGDWRETLPPLVDGLRGAF